MSGRVRTGKVLVLGDDTRSFLSVVRSLGRRGIEVHGAWCPAGCPALSSRYLAWHHELPPYRPGDRAWSDALAGLLAAEGFDLVIPCNDQSTLPLRERRAELERHARLDLLDDRAFEVTSDKAKTAELARRLGVRVAREMRVTSADEAPAVVRAFGLPVVLKPRSSFEARNLTRKRHVRKAYTEEALRERLARMLRSGGHVLAQENFIGKGVGVEVLAAEGEILAAFQHEREHEPLMGGGSSYRRSSPLDPELVAATEKLLAALHYTGVAMVEFKKNAETGAWILIEINGRFWGSLPLALAAGVEFPFWLYEMRVLGRRDFPRAYAANVYCRNTAQDLEWLYRNLTADRADPTLSTVPLAAVAREVLHLVRLEEHNDTLVLDDPAPALVELRQIGEHVGRVVAHKAELGLLSASPIRRAAALGTLRRVRRARRVLFVCKGNICRSPFAEAYGRRVLGSGVEVGSSGYYPVAGRGAPEVAVAVAGELGVDLTGHRSRVLVPAMLAEADLVLVFDEEDLRALVAAHPFARGKLRRFALLDGAMPLAIDDPYGGDEGVFRRTYEHIRIGLTAAAG
jgi:protein-tyrosine-phosphatase/predicted ATP-grasp superfamily ATP-dependent carboligase